MEAEGTHAKKCQLDTNRDNQFLDFGLNWRSLTPNSCKNRREHKSGPIRSKKRVEEREETEESSIYCRGTRTLRKRDEDVVKAGYVEH